MKHNESATQLLIIGIILCTAIFISDVYTPLGIADGISYIVVVLLTLWWRKKSYTIATAAVASVLTLAGIFFSPEGEGPSIYLTNRVLALLAIWSSAYVILRFMESERKALEVRHSLNALFANASVGIIIAGYDGKIKMANPLAEKLFGYRASDMQAMGLNQFFLDNSKLLGDPGAGSGLRETELKALNSKGDTFPVELRSSSYQLDGLNYQIIFLNDISERKKQEEIIRRSNEELKAFAKQLKETNAELENFAYISSHDLQEPLRKIQSFGDRLLHSEAEKFSEKGAEYMTRILSAAGRMQRLINDLLSLSRLSSKARPFESVHLGTIVNDVISDLEVSIRNSNARIHVLDELPVIEADPTQMRQLFQNLIANAIKFKKPDEDPLIKIYAVQSQNDQAGMVNIMVDDNGIGFDEKYLGKIFVIFQRLESAKYPGSGIGLAICKKIVQRHNGEINARSAKGQGSRFIIRLPLPTANKTVSPIHHSTLIAA